MARREIVISDLTGSEVDSEQVAKLTVSDHPALGNRTVELDAAVGEVEGLESSKIQLVSIGISVPGQPGVRRVVMEVAAFDRLFAGRDVEDILQGARLGGSASGPSAPRRPRAAAPSAARGDKVDYTASEHAGVLHRGRVTEAEAAFVREHLDVANENRRRAGQPEIDPADAKEKQRYGF